jgi:hypothetical protein
MNYSVDIESLHENFPADCQVPALLLDFGNWLKSMRAGSVGYFSLRSERFNDYWIENGADLHSNFAFFIRDPTGGQIGHWLYDGRTTVSPPIVLVGSEGELSILSDTLEEFLERLAEGNTQAPDLDSRDEDGKDDAEFRACRLESVAISWSGFTRPRGRTRGKGEFANRSPCWRQERSSV